MITYNSTNLENVFGCKIFKTDPDIAPARIYDQIEVPGRSGALLVDGKRYPNVEMHYMAVFSDEAKENSRDLINFLMSQIGYNKMSDSEQPDEFYQAAVIDAIAPVMSKNGKQARVDITFNRKPQRFLNTGAAPLSYSSTSFNVYNPTKFNSFPKMEVFVPSGIDGILTVRDQVITINNPGATTIIDSDMQDCYYGTQNLNSVVSFSDYRFPEFKPNANAITMQAGMTIKIWGNWWRL